MIDFGIEFSASPLMLILRGMGLERSRELALQAWDIGIGLVEIPLQTDEDERTLAALVREGSRRSRAVGAGTVISADLVRRARSAGAAFTVAPGLDPAVAEASVAAGMAHLPGVATGTEIQAALAVDCRWVKAFPASELGAGWIRAMRGPFPDVGIVATGGMNAARAVEFLDAGAGAVAVGAALGDPDELTALRALAARRD